MFYSVIKYKMKREVKDRVLWMKPRFCPILQKERLLNIYEQ